MRTDPSHLAPDVLAERCLREIVVWVVEEYGFRSWIWLPCCAADELESRWRATQHFSFDPPPDFLWGDWVDVREGPHREALLGLYEEINQRAVRSDPMVYRAWIDGDDVYSCLVDPTGRPIVHAGFQPAEWRLR